MPLSHLLTPQLFVNYSSFDYLSVDVSSMQAVCRDRVGDIPVLIFKLYSCSMCYSFLFHTGNELQRHSKTPWILIPKPGSTAYNANFSVIANISDETSRNAVCESLSDSGCKKWTSCCNSAYDCCQKQLTKKRKNVTTGLTCPSTWDGYGCFDSALASTRNYIQCPSYVEHASVSETAYKDCTENGTWYLDPGTGSEWTNYSTCVKKTDYHTPIYVGLACNIISLVLLIPACAIFLCIRQLRSQKRIKLHLCLFLSFIISSMVTLLWDFIIYRDRLNNEIQNSIMGQNSGGCKFLYILTRYAELTNYFWMFCEGFYLHRLIVHAFTVPKTLVPYYLFGWLVPWVPAVIYSIIRVAVPEYNTSCWVHNIGPAEWIMYIPNLFCILANIVFLANILRILCSKLQAHATEPSNYRKALKATFVLIPLFGIQQILVMYRPLHDSSLYIPYEIIQNIIKNLQGAAVSLIFCFFNGEVHTYIKSYIRKTWTSGKKSDFLRKGSNSSATQFTSVVSTGRRGTKTYDNSERGYIPLSTSSTANDVNDSKIPTNGHVTFAL